MQLFTSISRCKSPLDLNAMSIASLLPRVENSLDTLHRGKALRQALTSQHREFDLRHIEPTAMFRRVVKLEATSDPTRFLWLKRLVKRTKGRGIQIVQHDSDLFGVGKMHIDQILHRR